MSALAVVRRHWLAAVVGFSIGFVVSVFVSLAVGAVLR